MLMILAQRRGQQLQQLQLLPRRPRPQQQQQHLRQASRRCSRQRRSLCLCLANHCQLNSHSCTSLIRLLVSQRLCCRLLNSSSSMLLQGVG